MRAITTARTPAADPTCQPRAVQDATTLTNVLVPFRNDEHACEPEHISGNQWRLLLALTADGDLTAENLFFDGLRRRMLRLAERVLRTSDVDDLVQDVLIVVHRKYRDLLADSKLQDEAGFDRWWRRILYHRIGNDIRRRRFEFERRVPVERLLTVPSRDAADRLCEAAEVRSILLRALKDLNTRQRIALRQGMKSKHAPGGSTRQQDAEYARTYRARKALRRALKREAL